MSEEYNPFDTTPLTINAPPPKDESKQEPAEPEPAVFLSQATSSPPAPPELHYAPPPASPPPSPAIGPSTYVRAPLAGQSAAGARPVAGRPAAPPPPPLGPPVQQPYAASPTTLSGHPMPQYVPPTPTYAPPPPSAGPSGYAPPAAPHLQPGNADFSRPVSSSSLNIMPAGMEEAVTAGANWMIGIVLLTLASIWLNKLTYPFMMPFISYAAVSGYVNAAMLLAPAMGYTMAGVLTSIALLPLAGLAILGFKRHSWVFMIAMVVYGIDIPVTIITWLVHLNLWGVLFGTTWHGFVFSRMFAAFTAIREIERTYDGKPVHSQSDVIRQSPPPSYAAPPMGAMTPPAYAAAAPAYGGAPPFPAAQPPVLGYAAAPGAPLGVGNTSGTDGPTPVEVANFKWNWGAFLLPLFWAISHRLYAFGGIIFALNVWPWIVLALPGKIGLWIIGGLCWFGVVCWMSIVGHDVAWRNRHFPGGIEQYIDVQTRWIYAGLALRGIQVLGFVLFFSMVASLFSSLLGHASISTGPSTSTDGIYRSRPFSGSGSGSFGSSPGDSTSTSPDAGGSTYGTPAPSAGAGDTSPGGSYGSAPNSYDTGSSGSYGGGASDPNVQSPSDSGDSSGAYGAGGTSSDGSSDSGGGVITPDAPTPKPRPTNWFHPPN